MERHRLEVEGIEVNPYGATTRPDRLDSRHELRANAVTLLVFVNPQVAHEEPVPVSEPHYTAYEVLGALGEYRHHRGSWAGQPLR
jgi:hypothetical protein